MVEPFSIPGIHAKQKKKEEPAVGRTVGQTAGRSNRRAGGRADGWAGNRTEGRVSNNHGLSKKSDSEAILVGHAGSMATTIRVEGVGAPLSH